MRAWPAPGATWEDAVAGWDVVEAAIEGRGPAVCPDPDRLPECEIRDDTTLLIGTSGSTGAAKFAQLPASALLASVQGVHEHLGGPGRWLISVPPSHITGFQGILRSMTAGFAPSVLNAGAFTCESFADAAERMPRGQRRYTTLVPTQLVRLLDDPAGVRAARSFDMILIGGAPLSPVTRRRAERAGIRVTTGYGTSETGGGCVYEGKPLSCTRIRLTDGRVDLGGPMVASGYAGRPDLDHAFAEDMHAASGTAAESGVDKGAPAETGTATPTRWFRTEDLGEFHDGRLVLLGRADDMINTGGLKVAPRVVEDAILEAFDELADVVVVGLPDPEWSEIVAAAVQPVAGATAPDLASLRAGVDLPGHARPRFAAAVERLPQSGPGKPDRAAVRRLLADRVAASAPAGSPNRLPA